MTQKLGLYEIPTAGEIISINAERLLGCTKNYVRQFLECRNISAKSVKENLKHLEDWYSKQPQHAIGDKVQRRFFQTLFATSWNLERTKVKLDNYYTLRNKFSEFLLGDPCDFQMGKYLRTPYAIVLPKRNSEHHRIIMARLPAPFAFDALTIYKMFFMLLEYRYMNDALIGEHWIIDCKHVSLANVLALSPVTPKAILIFAHGYALKVKGIHFVNVPSYGEPLLNVVKTIIEKKKIIERIYFYSKPEELINFFPKSILPSDYGGEEQSCEEISKEWADTLQSPELREWFISQNDIRTDESKRLGQSDFYNTDIFGVDGSFRSLAID